MLRVRDEWSRPLMSSRCSYREVLFIFFLCLGVDDFDELWLERCSAHKETVDVLLGGELLAGSTSHRA